MKSAMVMIVAITIAVSGLFPGRAEADNTFCKVYVPAMTAGLVISLIAMRGPAARTSVGIYLAAMLPCLFTVAYAKTVLADTEAAMKKDGPYTTLVEIVGRGDADYMMDMVLRGASPEDIAKAIHKLAGPEDNMS